VDGDEQIAKDHGDPEELCGPQDLRPEIVAPCRIRLLSAPDATAIEATPLVLGFSYHASL
jgi:hypothetical protein